MFYNDKMNSSSNNWELKVSGRVIKIEKSRGSMIEHGGGRVKGKKYTAGQSTSMRVKKGKKYNWYQTEYVKRTMKRSLRYDTD